MHSSTSHAQHHLQLAKLGNAGGSEAPSQVCTLGKYPRAGAWSIQQHPVVAALMRFIALHAWLP